MRFLCLCNVRVTGHASIIWHNSTMGSTGPLWWRGRLGDHCSPGRTSTGPVEQEQQILRVIHDTATANHVEHKPPARSVSDACVRRVGVCRLMTWCAGDKYQYIVRKTCVSTALPARGLLCSTCTLLLLLLFLLCTVGKHQHVLHACHPRFRERACCCSTGPVLALAWWPPKRELSRRGLSTYLPWCGTGRNHEC